MGYVSFVSRSDNSVIIHHDLLADGNDTEDLPAVQIGDFATLLLDIDEITFNGTNHRTVDRDKRS